MKKFLFINTSGDFLGIAQRVQGEGYETYSWYSSDVIKGKGTSGKGMIHLVDDWFDVIAKYKDHKDELLILFDDNSFGDTIDYLRSEGWHVIGGSHFADTAEHSREIGNKIAKAIGMKTPPTWVFKTFKEGKDFLNEFRKRYPDAQFVFKGDGVKMAGSSKTYVSKSIDDCLWFLDWIEKDQSVHNYTVSQFELQLKIEGLEADFSSWFTGEMFVNNIAMTFEEKRIDGLGVATGCMGQVVSFEPATKSKFFREYLSKLSPILKQTYEVNEWAANTIISAKNNQPYFLEWTPRFGWDSTFGELTILQETGRSIAEFFIRLAFHQSFPKGFFPDNIYSCAVRLFSESVGTKGEDVKGKPISWKSSIDKYLWWYSIRKRDDGRYELTDNPIGVICSTGKTPEEAIAKTYAMIDPSKDLISTPDLFYSPSIGKRAIEGYQTLRKTGWF